MKLKKICSYLGCISVFAVILMATSTNAQTEINFVYDTETHNWKVDYNFFKELQAVTLTNGVQLKIQDKLTKKYNSYFSYVYEPSHPLVYTNSKYPEYVQFSDSNSLIYRESFLPELAFLPRNYTTTLKSSKSKPSTNIRSKYLFSDKLKRGDGFEYYFDNELPYSVKSLLLNNIGLLIEFYEEQFSIKPIRNLEIYISFVEQPTFKTEGHVAENQILLIIMGPDINQIDTFSVNLTLAHETALIWLSGYKDSTPKWLTEGMAEYFAIDSLLQLEVINENQYLYSINFSANQCIEILNIVKDVADMDFYYNCGLIVHYVVDDYLKKSSESDLYNLAKLLKMFFIWSLLQNI